MVSLATLDAIMSPEWEYRRHSFNKDWDRTKRHRMGSARTGTGDGVFVLFTPAGTALKGYAHECTMAHPGRPPRGVFIGFPESIEDFVTEPAFTMEDTTFCMWHLPGQSWSVGPVTFPEGEDPDGSERLLELLAGRPEDYRAFVKEYYEAEVPLEIIRSVYRHAPLTGDLVRSLNDDLSMVDLEKDLVEIGYG